MSEEKLKVLEMLKENQISTEEALNLLEALKQEEDHTHNHESGHDPRQYQYGRGGHSHNHGPRSYRNPRNGHVHSQPWINPVFLDDLRENIMESARNVAEFVQNQDFMYDHHGHSGPALTYLETLENLPEYIAAIKVAGKNDAVNIMGHDENNITLEARYRPKFGMDPNISFEAENGRYTLYYDANALRSIGVNLKVPKRALGDLYIENKNASLTLSQLNFNTGDFVTKNANLRANFLTGDQMHLASKNAAIEAEGLVAKDLELTTSNAKLSLRNAEAESMRLATSNAPIHCDEIDGQQILAKTSNAPIKLTLDERAVRSHHPQYTVDASTSNANIVINTPFSVDTPAKIKASTTWGNARTNFAGMTYSQIDKGYIDATSPDYDNANKKFSTVLQSSNGSVNINARG